MPPQIERVEAKMQFTTLGLRDEIAARLFVARMTEATAGIDTPPGAALADVGTDVSRYIAEAALRHAQAFCRARHAFDSDPANRPA
jgi:hypothetical protein